MGKAVSAETERGKRLPNLAQKQSKTAKVQGIESKPVEKMQLEKAQTNDFTQAVQALSQQMAALTAEVSQLKAQINIKILPHNNKQGEIVANSVKITTVYNAVTVFCVDQKNILLVVTRNLRSRETTFGCSRGDNCSLGGTNVPQM